MKHKAKLWETEMTGNLILEKHKELMEKKLPLDDKSKKDEWQTRMTLCLEGQGEAFESESLLSHFVMRSYQSWVQEKMMLQKHDLGTSFRCKNCYSDC